MTTQLQLININIINNQYLQQTLWWVHEDEDVRDLRFWQWFAEYPKLLGSDVVLGISFGI